jgi:hypothetical protein
MSPLASNTGLALRAHSHFMFNADWKKKGLQNNPNCNSRKNGLHNNTSRVSRLYKTKNDKSVLVLQ